MVFLSNLFDLEKGFDIFLMGRKIKWQIGLIDVELKLGDVLPVPVEFNFNPPGDKLRTLPFTFPNLFQNLLRQIKENASFRWVWERLAIDYKKTEDILIKKRKQSENKVFVPNFPILDFTFLIEFSIYQCRY